MSTNKEITIEGKTFNSVTEAAKYYNLNCSTVYNRLNRGGWSIEEAFELVDIEDSKKKAKEITVEGKTFDSIAEAAKYYNLAPGTVNTRLNKGWSIEEAFGLVERKNESFKPITVNGRTFESIAEACRYYNLKDNTVCARLKKGYSIDEAFKPLNKKVMRKEITLEGKTFKSIREAAKYYNMAEDLISTRLRHGWSIEEAFELKYRNDNCKLVTLEGKTFKSVTEAAKYYNIDGYIIRNRLRYGWSIEEAFGLVEKKSNYNGIEITINGKTFNSIKEAAKYYKLDPSTVHNRLKSGWTIEEAFKDVDLEEPKYSNLTVFGKTFKNIAELSKYYNINYNTVYGRLDKGWTVEDAISIPVREGSRGKTVIVNGNEFISIAEACRYYNLKYNNVSTRLRHGWSIEEAFELKYRNDNCRLVTLEGKTFKSIAEACRYYNLDYDNVLTRLKFGWTTEEAFELVDKKKR